MAEPMPRDLLGFDFRRFVAACVTADEARVGGRLSGDEKATALALAGAGLAALFALPFLLLSSVALSTPLAVPAAIGLGYLAVSRTLAAHQRRRAGFINAAVLSGLVGWSLLLLLVGEGPLSPAGLAAALMSPLFAAAPAIARSLISIRTAAVRSDSSTERDAAMKSVTCPDQPTPLDRHVAVEACLNAERASTARSVSTATRKERVSEPRCDVAEAAAFALRHVAARAAAKKIALTSTIEPHIAVACDQQTGRRIVHQLLESVLSGSHAGSPVHVVVRGLKGAALIRATSELGVETSGADQESDELLDVGALRTLVDRAGGTLVVDVDGRDITLSVRLGLATRHSIEERMETGAKAA